MTEPPDEPEVFIYGDDPFGSGPPEPGSGGSGARGDRPPHGPGGRARWLIAGVAAVLLAAIIVIPQLAGNSDDDAVPVPTSTESTTPTPDPSKTTSTAARTTSHAATGSDMTTSPPITSSTLDGSWETTTSGPDSTASGTVPTSDGDAPETPETPQTPTTEQSAPLDLPDSSGWRVVGFQSSRCDGCAGRAAVIRYTPASGVTQTTQIPGEPGSDGPVSFLVTDGTAIIKPYGTIGGFQVPDGSPAASLGHGLLGRGPMLPSSQHGTVWLAHETGSGEVTRFDQVALDGSNTGKTLVLPPALSHQGPYGFTSDGAGHVLGTGTGGTYLLTVDGARLVTHGNVLAAGPTALLIRECDDAGQCHAFVLDRKSGKHRPLPDFTPVPGLLRGMLQGVISLDGKFAVSLGYGDGPPRFVRTFLGTGHADELPGVIDGTVMLTVDASSAVAFTPDSRYVLLNTNRGIVPVELATGTAHDPLPIHAVAAFAVVPSPGAAASGG